MGIQLKFFFFFLVSMSKWSILELEGQKLVKWLFRFPEAEIDVFLFWALKGDDYGVYPATT